MPYPNEHAVRVRDPADFIPESFRSKELKDGVRMILGKLKTGNGSMVLQAYRFPVDKFTVEQVKQWVTDNKIKFIKFEQAQNEPQKELQHFGVLGMRWGTRRGELYRKNTMTSYKRQKDLDKKELSRLEGKKRQSKLDEKKIAILKERVASVKGEKLSYYERDQQMRSRAKKIGLAVTALWIAAPLLYEMSRVVPHNAKVLGNAYKSQRRYEKYGGFDPKKVVNGRWKDVADSPAVDLGRKLLGAGNG